MIYLKIREKYTCPLELALDMISGKWKPITLWRLRLGNQQLATLNRDIYGINQKMLIEHLGELVECGLVHKKVYDGYPLKVEYCLTEIGQQFIQGLAIFQKIGEDILTKAASQPGLPLEFQLAQRRSPVSSCIK
jgi:DNA-binding HxlR family transcriptional regulator